MEREYLGLGGTCTTAPHILDELATVTSDEACLLSETRNFHVSEDPNQIVYYGLNRQREALRDKYKS